MALLYAATDHHLLLPGTPLYDVDLDNRGWKFDAKNVRFHHIDQVYDTVYEELENLQTQIDSVSAGGEDNTASNLGAGSGIFFQKDGVDLEFKSLVGGTNVTLASDNDTITINAASSSDTHMMNADLTADADRSHDIDGQDWELHDGGDSVLKYTAPGLVQLGPDENYVAINNGANQVEVWIDSANTLVFTTTKTVSYQDVVLDQTDLIFQNADDNLIRFQAPTTGVTNTTYTLPTAGSVGYMFNNASDELSFGYPNLMSDLADVDSQFYESVGDIFTSTLTTWSGNEPSLGNNAAWLAGFNDNTYVMTYDPVLDIWRPVLGFELASLFSVDLNTNIYTDDGVLDSARIVDTDNNNLTFYDVTNPLTSSGTIRLHNHRFRSSGNDIQVGYFSAADSTAQTGAVRFFTQNTTNGGTSDAELRKETGASGAFVMQNRNFGELWLQNASSGANNKIILRNDGEVEFNMYGSGNFTGTPTKGLAVDTDGIIIETNPNTSIHVACSDETTALTTGTAKVTFRMRNFQLTEVRASVTTAPTGDRLIIDINEGGVSLLSTKLSIDATEKTSTTAATPVVISDSTIADDAEITIDIDQIGSTVAGAGLIVELIGYYL